PRPPGAHPLRVLHRPVRGPLRLPPRPRRGPGRARRAPPRLAAPEVPVNFAAPWFLAGTALAILVGVLLVLGSMAGARAVARFGDPARVRALVTGDAAKRRAWKGVL